MPDVFLITARVALAAVLFAAAVLKLRDRAGTREAAEALGVPPWLGRLAAWVLPPVELTAAALLLAGATARAGAALAAALLGAFTVLLVANLASGNRPVCRCFGELSSEPISWRSVARNAVLLGLAAIAWGSGPGVVAWGVEKLSDPRRLRAAVVILGLAVLAEAVALLVLRGDAGGGRAGGASTLPVGSPAPSFRLRGLDGEPVSLSQLISQGSPLLLVFIDPGCGPCAALLPELSEWHDTLADQLRVVTISSGSVSDNQAKVGDLGLPVLLQKGDEVAKAYRYLGTPSAVVVDTTGHVASELVAGPQAIRDLVASTVRPVPRQRQAGDLAPSFVLPDLTGDPVSLAEFAGELTLVVFWSPGCGFCQAMLPELRRLEDELSDAPGLDMLFVSDGSAVANRRMRLRSTVVLDSEPRATMAAYGSDGTPTAVLVDAEGRIASDLASGAGEVLALAERGLKLAGLAARLAAEPVPMPVASPTRLQRAGSGPSSGSRPGD